MNKCRCWNRSRNIKNPKFRRKGVPASRYCTKAVLPTSGTCRHIYEKIHWHKLGAPLHQKKHAWQFKHTQQPRAETKWYGHTWSACDVITREPNLAEDREDSSQRQGWPNEYLHHDITIALYSVGKAFVLSRPARDLLCWWSWRPICCLLQFCRLNMPTWQGDTVTWHGTSEV